MAYFFWHSIRQYLTFFLAYTLTFYLTFYLASILTYFLAYIWHLFWHFIWHLFRHSFWQMFWHSLWHSFWHMYLAYLLTVFLAFYLVYLRRFFVVEVRQGSWACCSGPAGTTLIPGLLFGSGEDHCDHKLAVHQHSFHHLNLDPQAPHLNVFSPILAKMKLPVSMASIWMTKQISRALEYYGYVEGKINHRHIVIHWNLYKHDG